MGKIKLLTNFISHISKELYVILRGIPPFSNNNKIRGTFLGLKIPLLTSIYNICDNSPSFRE